MIRNRYLQPWLATFLLLLATLTAVLGLVATAAEAVPGVRVTLGASAVSPRLIVHAQHEEVAQATLETAEQALDRLSPHFTRQLAGRITIVVVQNNQEYERIEPVPSTRGFATFGGTQVFLRGDKLNEQVVAHELTHILLGQNVRPGLTIPDWFNEGLAEYASGASQATLELLYSGGAGKLLPLPELDRVDALESPNRELASVEGLAVIQFLVERYGDDQLWRLVDSLNRASTFNQALLDTYGRSNLQLSEEWMAYARENYSLLSPKVLQMVGLLAIGGLLLIAMLVWLARRRSWAEETRLAAGDSEDGTQVGWGSGEGY